VGAAISSLAAQLTAVSVRQAHGVATQSRSIHQVASAVAQLHAAAGQIMSIAGEVSSAGEQARQSVEQAQALVWQSREAVQRNRVQVQQVIARMQTLEQLTERITQFVNRIRDLSDETQLLALNATIEAAGAGPLGRRFGVVAAEVQNLSHRSNEIVDQIRGLIADLQQAGLQTQTATESSMAVADEVELLADQVRQTLVGVVGAVGRTSELAHLIATATHEQTRAAEQMTQTMHEIAQVSAATSQDTTALEGVVGEMTHAAGLLSSALARLPPAPPAAA
jgi:methyl-accepting chemotaxis protein